ncbi:hypothetical protein CALVIDRAFT_597308 [Calocera viscosa TUFC12733]|uniref:Uncharacterized protein n=1 Tax=Calocera viscosa (strain TUFC12733) TaxID=1330018 RepID=A0A167NLM8_CALVF|nr:hypothetical protein CALVIDRAFT_597308 [Calocera viscosa TUFC12733]
MYQPASSSAPRVVVPQIPPGLTEDILSQMFVGSVLRESSKSTTPQPNGYSHGATVPEATALPILNGVPRLTAFPEFRLTQDDLTPNSNINMKEEEVIGPVPTNELLNLYQRASTPQEGLENVAKYVGEFMALLRLDMEISGFFVAPVPGNSGRAVNCNNHWFLGVPLKARPGFMHPVGGSWQVPDKPIIDATAPPESDDDGYSEISVDVLSIQPLGISGANGTAKSTVSGTPIVRDNDDDLVIHYDDAPVTRALGRAFKDSEVIQAREDIKRIRSRPETVTLEISRMDWHARKRTCHLHIIAFMYPYIGNSNFREIPARLREKQLCLHNWPARCVIGPSANIGKYNADDIRDMLFSIWRGKMEVKPWSEEDKTLVAAIPSTVYNIPLLIDSTGKAIRFERDLDPDQLAYASEAVDTPAPSDREGSVDLRRAIQAPRGRGRPRKHPIGFTPTPSPVPGAETSRGTSSGAAEASVPKRRGRPPKYLKSPEILRPLEVITPPAPAPAPAPPSPQTSVRPEDIDFHKYVEDPRRDNKRFFSDAQVIEAQGVILERRRDLAQAKQWMEQFDWNTRRKLCRLHLNAFLYEQLGNTEFHEILERLHRKRLRLFGWPVVCELPGGQHVGNWNKLQVEALFFAIWDDSLHFERWHNFEQAKNYPYLIEDTNGVRHRPKPEQVEIPRDHEPNSLTYGLPLDTPVDVRKIYLAHLAREQGRGKGKERAVDSEFEGTPAGDEDMRDETPESSEGRRAYGLRNRGRESGGSGGGMGVSTPVDGDKGKKRMAEEDEERSASASGHKRARLAE